eukprot:6487230-Amphidinium_carterae.2
MKGGRTARSVETSSNLATFQQTHGHGRSHNRRCPLTSRMTCNLKQAARTKRHTFQISDMRTASTAS